MLDLYTYKEQPRQENEQERIRFFYGIGGIGKPEYDFCKLL